MKMLIIICHLAIAAVIGIVIGASVAHMVFGVLPK